MWASKRLGSNLNLLDVGLASLAVPQSLNRFFPITAFELKWAFKAMKSMDVDSCSKPLFVEPVGTYKHMTLTIVTVWSKIRHCWIKSMGELFHTHTYACMCKYVCSNTHTYTHFLNCYWNLISIQFSARQWGMFFRVVIKYLMILRESKTSCIFPDVMAWPKLSWVKSDE